ncbi:sodium- and chloride-dependent glycine transporter 2-like [Haliotis rubra]|uniref:sodium- and chloride-dependent glycine transporter 2-like n=1 Tax=Haliotis rubra TaxID=36100 RepID=UPI001EE4EC22|nr:sodium- and chloride-dependent glycine transporter 2-like [Haliotis rubra]XP_046544079.1 sodium- and chloride-dependent glycine transporter 2-like [Haliotis rubra]XP_046544080.1 sodium- and chloride-dependent glycine transporter 2-like [Haliotis rubra]XP_046544081.1 sodium- and chloride-dependent glycine transporter 2-like [Haliotis rubra]
MADVESKEVTVPSKTEEEQPLQPAQESATSVPVVSTHVTRFEFADQTVAPQQGLEREHWTCNAEFIMAALASATDYRYMFMFPYLCYSLGGITFIILYGTFLLLFGVPIFYMDLSLGQFCGKGPAHIYNLSPLLRGIGVGMVVVTAMSHPLYGAIPTWSLYYLFQSGSIVLPWSTCSNEWNTMSCVDSQTVPLNTTGDSYMSHGPSSPALEYFYNRVLQMTPGIEHSGRLQWELVGCRFATVLLIFAALFWGVKVIGKVMFVTVPLIFLLLLALFLRGMTLPGSLEGIQYLLIPSVRGLLDERTWTSALLSALYTVGVASGTINTLASYKRFRSTALRDSFIVVGVSLVVGIVSSLMMFGFFGALAEHKHVSMGQVVDGGIQAVFVALAEMTAQLPVAQFWSFALFFMLLLIGLSKQILYAEVVITAVLDCLSRRSHLIRFIITAAFCGASFLLTLPYLSQGGIYFFIMVDASAMRLAPYILTFLQLITVGWIYGIEQLSRDIKMMTGLRPPVVYKLIWCFVLPLLMLLMFVDSLRKQHRLGFRSYLFPVWADVIGWFISLLPFAPLPMFVVVTLIVTRSQFQPVLSPRPDWGPADPAYHAEYHSQKSRNMTLTDKIKAVFSI